MFCTSKPFSSILPELKNPYMHTQHCMIDTQHWNLSGCPRFHCAYSLKRENHVWGGVSPYFVEYWMPRAVCDSRGKISCRAGHLRESAYCTTLQHVQTWRGPERRWRMWRRPGRHWANSLSAFHHSQNLQDHRKALCTYRQHQQAWR